MVVAHPPEPAAAAAAIDCSVKVTKLVDERADPAIIGVYFGKAVKAPEDRAEWLAGTISGLTRHGIAPRLDLQTVVTEPGDASIALEKAWVTNALADIAVSVVFRLDRTMPDGSVQSTRYRGTQQKMTYFSGGEGKIQRGLDAAFDAALESMAADLRKDCNKTAQNQPV